MYALGLVLMAHATSAPMLDLSAGVLIGFGLAGASFMVVLAAFGKILPPQWRSIAFGLGTAAGSFGQFLFSPLAVLLMSAFGWQQALVTFAVVVLAVLPLSRALAMPRAETTTHAAPRCGRHSPKPLHTAPTCC
jgi:MFS family permease